MTVGIVDLVTICRREQARAMALFEAVGGWVASTLDPALQRVFATGAHRHAWHAGLWGERIPAIPVSEETAVDAELGLDGCEGDEVRRDAYAGALTAMLAELGELRGRIDDELDPATARVIDLVASDAHTTAAALGVHLVSDTK